MGLLAGTSMGGRLASFGMLGLVFPAGVIIHLVLFVLAALSVFSWAVILFKSRELRRAQQDSEAFLEVYHAGSLEDAYSAARDLDRSPLAAVFLAAYSELKRLARASGQAVTLSESHVDALATHVTWPSSLERRRL